MSDNLETGEYNIETIECPSCGYEDAKVITHILDIPYYSDYASITITCRSCGYRITDFMNLQTRPGTIMTYQIQNEDDTRTKVVRSREGIVSIPELGISIEPTGDGTTWIRNIEGILEDIKEKLIISLKQSETTEERRTVKQRLKLLKSLSNNEREFRVVVEDPSGNSVILPHDEKKLEITFLENE